MVIVAQLIAIWFNFSYSSHLHAQTDNRGFYPPILYSLW